MKLNADTVIVGSGVAGLFSALNLPREQDIILITKSDTVSYTHLTLPTILRV